LWNNGDIYLGEFEENNIKGLGIFCSKD